MLLDYMDSYVQRMYVRLNPEWEKKIRRVFFSIDKITVRASHNIRVLSTELERMMFENINNSAEWTESWWPRMTVRQRRLNEEEEDCRIFDLSRFEVEWTYLNPIIEQFYPEKPKQENHHMSEN